MHHRHREHFRGARLADKTGALVRSRHRGTAGRPRASPSLASQSGHAAARAPKKQRKGCRNGRANGKQPPPPSLRYGSGGDRAAERGQQLGGAGRGGEEEARRASREERREPQKGNAIETERKVRIKKEKKKFGERFSRVLRGTAVARECGARRSRAGSEPRAAVPCWYTAFRKSLAGRGLQEAVFCEMCRKMR